jgi:hypothetical protein
MVINRKWLDVKLYVLKQAIKRYPAFLFLYYKQITTLHFKLDLLFCPAWGV